MSIAIQRRRGTTAETAAFTGLLGEVTVDTDKDVLVVHDGATAGGFPLIRQDAVSNPNLLINADGLEIENQRVATTVATGAYGFDRWKVVHNCTTVTVSQTATGARHTVTTKGTGTSLYIRQQLESFLSLADTSVTMSISLKSDVAAYLRIADNFTNATSAAHTGGGGSEVLIVTFTPAASPGGVYADIVAPIGADADYIEFEWIKLEVGSVATPFVADLPSVNLAKCQRYYYSIGGDNVYQRVCFGKANSSNDSEGIITLPTTMRVAPSVSYSALSDFTIEYTGGTEIPSAITINNPGKTIVGVTFAGASSPATDQTLIRASNTTNMRITFDAEL